jgi:hypothetical protein
VSSVSWVELDEGINLLTQLKPLDVKRWQTVINEYAAPPVTTTSIAG